MKTIVPVFLMYTCYGLLMVLLWVKYHDYTEPAKETPSLVKYETRMNVPEDPKDTEPQEIHPEKPQELSATDNPSQPESHERNAGPSTTVDKTEPERMERILIEPSGRTNRETTPGHGVQPRVEIELPERPIVTTGPSSFVMPKIEIIPEERTQPKRVNPDVRIDIPERSLGEDEQEGESLEPVEPIIQPQRRTQQTAQIQDDDIIPIEQVARVMNQRGLDPISGAFLSDVNQRLSTHALRQYYCELRQNGQTHLTVNQKTLAGGVVRIVLDIRTVPPGISFYGDELEYLIEESGRIEHYLKTLCEILERENS
ncbi:MAG: hypothetical protein K8R90_02715 [Candidatus Cloacimonetes bacterium]|nr:hypothetical protein [Candidatus Cloacimonadota bacterium]